MYSCFGTYTSPIHRYRKQMIEHVLVEQLPVDGFGMNHYSTLLPFVHETHRDPVVHRFYHDFNDTEAD